MGFWQKRIVFILSLIGLSIATYLYLNSGDPSAVVCKTDGCLKVLSSKYAYLLGLPTAFWGMVWYSLLALTVIWNQKPPFLSNWLNWWIIGGVLFNIYLLYAELFLIKSICLWCSASAAIVFLILLVNLKKADSTK